MKFLEKVKNKKADKIFTALFFILMGIGFVSLWSSSIVIAEKVSGDKFFYIKSQLIKGILPSILLFFVFSFLNYKKIRKFSKIIYFISIILLILVLVIGLASGGSKSWIDLSFFSFQPSEIAKISIIIFLAYFFEKADKNIQNLKGGFYNFLILCGIPFVLILLQPDLGTLMIFFIVCLIMAFVAKVKIRHLLALLSVVTVIVVLFLKVDKGTRFERVDIFLNPEKYSSQGEGYHIDQALIAVGTGGVFGKGIGKSVQKFSYLPQVIADSIFAVMAEELGFIFITAIMGVFFMFIYRCINIAKNAPDNFSRYFIIGFSGWIAMQVFVNVGAMIRLSPLTGVTLPFISYGSTSMWVVAIGSGIVSNISRYSEENNDGKLVNKKRSNVFNFKE